MNMANLGNLNGSMGVMNLNMMMYGGNNQGSNGLMFPPNTSIAPIQGANTLNSNTNTNPINNLYGIAHNSSLSSSLNPSPTANSNHPHHQALLQHHATQSNGSSNSNIHGIPPLQPIFSNNVVLTDVNNSKFRFFFFFFFIFFLIFIYNYLIANSFGTIPPINKGLLSKNPIVSNSSNPSMFLTPQGQPQLFDSPLFNHNLLDSSGSAAAAALNLNLSNLSLNNLNQGRKTPRSSMGIMVPPLDNSSNPSLLSSNIQGNNSQSINSGPNPPQSFNNTLHQLGSNTSSGLRSRGTNRPQLSQQLAPVLGPGLGNNNSNSNIMNSNIHSLPIQRTSPLQQSKLIL